MFKFTRLGNLLSGAFLLAVMVVGFPISVSAQSDRIDFKLLYRAAQLSNEAYEGRSKIFGKHPGKSTWVATPGKTKVQYLFFQNHSRKVQVIAVRGTANDTNWDLDLDTRGVKDKRADILMHRGFKTVAEVIYRDVKPHLKRGYTTYLTGHSLGGAVAAILGIYLYDDKFKIGGIYTFGQPKFTNAAGAKHYENLPLLRVIHRNDVVTLLPDHTKKSGKDYAHLGPVINLLSGPYYVYGTGQQALQFSQGSLQKFFGQLSVPDHKMKGYLKNLRGKLGGSKQVSFEDRSKYIVLHFGERNGGPLKRKNNFNLR